MVTVLEKWVVMSLVIPILVVLNVCTSIIRISLVVLSQVSILVLARERPILEDSITVLNVPSLDI
jgi:hypothetical protein